MRSETALDRWSAYLANCGEFVRTSPPLESTGRLTRVAGLVMEATGLRLPVGASCTVSQQGAGHLEAEVVGFSGERLFLMPGSEINGLTPGARVVAVDVNQAPPSYGRAAHPWRRAEDRAKHLPVGDGLLGRVLDGAGRPLDRLGPLRYEQRGPLSAHQINPMRRAPVNQPLDVGVRAINALNTVGRGQRMGLFAGSGVGKSVLLGMMTRYTAADVTIVGLIGERGREVKEFIEDILGPEGLARAVVIAAPADAPPLLRVQGAAYACAIAEWFRDQGRDVLLIMDSLTRYAMAHREIALAIGEPPATRGYPPSVFARLPQLVERAGNGDGTGHLGDGTGRLGDGTGRRGEPGDADRKGGSITAFYSVLTEGDDPQDPVADAARAILDGHVVLSRPLAEQGHYPAIDVEASISRVMNVVAGAPNFELARRFRQLYSRYNRNRDLFAVGAYTAGADPTLDRAVRLYPLMERFLHQGMLESASIDASFAALQAVLAQDTP